MSFEQARLPGAVGWPHPTLRSLLAREYVAYDEGSSQHDHLVRPATTTVSLIMKIRDSAHRPPAFVHGVHDSYSRIEGECAPSYLEIRLAPLGAYTMLGVPMNEINGTIVDLTEIFGPESNQLSERIRDAATWSHRFKLVDECLLRRAEEGPRPSPAVTEAWQRLLATAGTASIRSIAADVGWSHKHLIAKFKQQVGLTPKTVARLVRFDGLLARLSDGPLTRWPQIAADCGYSDQAHLIRDFREFTGTTPTRFVEGWCPSDHVLGIQDGFILRPWR